MKLKAKVIVGVLSLATLGTLSYFTEKQSMISAKEQVVVATQKEEVKERPKKLNYTIEKFLQQYKDKPQEEIDQFFEGFGDKNRIVAIKEPGDLEGTVDYGFLSSLIEETDDPELNSEKSTTYGELKMALQEERAKRH